MFQAMVTRPRKTERGSGQHKARLRRKPKKQSCVLSDCSWHTRASHCLSSVLSGVLLSGGVNNDA